MPRIAPSTIVHVDGSASQPSKSLPLKIFTQPGPSAATSIRASVERSSFEARAPARVETWLLALSSESPNCTDAQTNMAARARVRSFIFAPPTESQADAATLRESRRDALEPPNRVVEV